MQKSDVDRLYAIALAAFKPAYDEYGLYPAIMNVHRQKFVAPLFLGVTFLIRGKIVGGAFVVAYGKTGEIGSIFIDPDRQKKGLGKEAMLLIETMYPKVNKWEVEVPSENLVLQSLCESLGYIKTQTKVDSKSGLSSYKYIKSVW